MVPVHVLPLFLNVLTPGSFGDPTIAPPVDTTVIVQVVGGMGNRFATKVQAGGTVVFGHEIGIPESKADGVELTFVVYINWISPSLQMLVTVK
jgi:hypothetical protein